ncbi:MAG: hypothetical protein ACHQRK_09685, partial [Gemmatimonadales bacterium]
MRLDRLLPALGAAAAIGCATVRTTNPARQPAFIPHSQWESRPPLGYAADANRRNEPTGGTLVFHDLSVTVLGTSADSTGIAADSGKAS